jgi:Glycosyltransferase family 25 (LPS biosynthesis protein)
MDREQEQEPQEQEPQEQEQKQKQSKTPSWNIQNIPAFCITLERRLDRWKRFQTQPGVQPLALKRFLGVDGKTIDLRTDDRVATFTKRNILTKTRRSHEELNSIGGVGCALSHIAVWQWMVDNQQPLCLVFEDDAIVPADFTARANRLIQTSLLHDAKAWDLWLLGGTWDDLSSIKGESSVHRVGSFVLFHAYVMTLPMAQRLLRDVYPIHGHIDLWTSVYGYLNDLRIVGAPSLRLQQNPKTKTDIQTEADCALCDVPSDFYKTHRLVPHMEWTAAKAASVALLLLVAGYGVSRMISKSG